MQLNHTISMSTNVPLNQNPDPRAEKNFASKRTQSGKLKVDLSNDKQTPQKQKFKARTTPRGRLMSDDEIFHSGELSDQTPNQPMTPNEVKTSHLKEDPSEKQGSRQNFVKSRKSLGSPLKGAPSHPQNKRRVSATELVDITDANSDDLEDSFNRRAYGFEQTQDMLPGEDSRTQPFSAIV